MKNFILVVLFICLSIVIKAQSIKNDTPKLLNAEGINTNIGKEKTILNDSTIRLSITSGNIIKDTIKIIRELQNSYSIKNDSLIFEKK
ncbi:MAG: hypothetical protein AB7O47_13635 [Flavobacteriales bacterium]